MTRFTWADAKTIVAAGATAGTFKAADEITLRKGTGALLYLQYLLVGAIPTSGENGVPILRLNSDSIGINNQDFVCSNIVTDGVATNDKEAPVYAGIIPLDFAGDFSFADINLSVTSNVAVTGGWEGAVGIVYADSPPDAKYEAQYMFGMHGPIRGGAKAEQDAGISAAGETSFTTGIAIPAGFNQLKGLLGLVNANGPTSAEAVSGITTFSSADIPNFSPQKWVFPFGLEGSLGTPVGTPVSASKRTMYWPTKFELTGQKATIEISQKLAVLITNAADGVAAAVYA